MAEKAPDLSGKDISDLGLNGTRVRGAAMVNAHITDAFMLNASIDGMFVGLKINGIDVAPLIQAELRKKHPLMSDLSPTSAAGVREGFAKVYGLWDELIDRARSLDESTLHTRVDDEWSFVETMRHLVFATDIWIVRLVADDPAPIHPWGLPPPFFGDVQGLEPNSRPTFEEALRMRADRCSRVSSTIDGLDDDALERICTPSTEGPPPGQHKVGDALRTILKEEYWHYTYAVRDLDVLAPG